MCLQLPPERSLLGENLRARSSCGLETRPHLPAACEVMGVTKVGARTGAGKKEVVEEGGQQREAAPGLLREARGGTGAAGFLGDALESRLPHPPRLSGSPVTGLGRGGNARV